MTTVSMERVCGRGGCGQLVTGRADKKFCSDACRAADSRSRTEPNRTHVTASRAAPISASRTEIVLTWDPPSESRRAYLTGEPCPHCGQPIAAGPRGTWRVCIQCEARVVPAAVSAPYSRGEAAAPRQVISQRERDLAALALAKRKGVMLGQLGQLAADDRLLPESLPVVEWFADEVRAAAAGGRLDELAELFADPAAGIRRRRWWQGQPALAGPAGDDGLDYDDPGDDYADDDGQPGRSAPAAALAAPPPQPGAVVVTWADALAAQGWRLTVAVDGCQVTTAGGQLCGAEAARRITGGWACGRHYQQLCAVISERARARR